MKKGIVLNGKKLSNKDIVAIRNHPKTVAFIEKGKHLLNGVDLSIMDLNAAKVRKGKVKK